MISEDPITPFVDTGNDIKKWYFNGGGSIANNGLEVGNSDGITIGVVESGGDLHVALVYGTDGGASDGLAEVQVTGAYQASTALVVKDDGNEGIEYPDTMAWKWSKCCTDGFVVLAEPGSKVCFDHTSLLQGVSKLRFQQGDGSAAVEISTDVAAIRDTLFCAIVPNVIC